MFGAVALVDDADLKNWFCSQVLPLESALTAFIRRNWREPSDVIDLRQEIYERVLVGARTCLPHHTSGYLYTIARNHMANRARRAKIVSIDLVADIDTELPVGTFEPEPGLIARDELRRAMAGLEQLPPRCREVVRLRKVEGLSTREVAERMGVGTDTVEKQLTLGIRALTDFMLGGTGKIQRQSRIGFRRKERP
jgi:RNA polymerase sigma-70 factor (ECF subfamily)